VAKKASVPGPLVAIRRGHFLSYFSNQGKDMVYFLLDWKRAVLRAFLVLAKMPEWKKEPDKGVFVLNGIRYLDSMG
jgi:hypothetical protein